MEPSGSEGATPITHILRALSENPQNRQNLDALFNVVYDELHAMAEGFMRRERAGHTFSPTVLVSEAYLKMAKPDKFGFENRAHFFGSAARAMRQILVSYAESRNRQKRGGRWERVTFTDIGDEQAQWEFEIIALNEALSKLAELDERAARVAELRIFAGLAGSEIAEALDVSRRTVSNDWAIARRWLSWQMEASDGS